MKKFSGSQFQCGRCGLHFAGPHSFARHSQIGDTAVDLECLTPEQMMALGMRETRFSFWTIDAPRPLSTSASKRPIVQSPVSALQEISPTPCPHQGSDDAAVNHAHTGHPLEAA
jgi:hypothetical protein